MGNEMFNNCDQESRLAFAVRSKSMYGGSCAHPGKLSGGDATATLWDIGPEAPIVPELDAGHALVCLRAAPPASFV